MNHKIIVIEQKSYNCSEDSDISPITEGYINNQCIYGLCSEEAIDMVIQINEKDKTHPFFGKHHSEESKKKISNSLKGEKNPNFGKHRSEDTKLKISNSQKGKKNHRYGKHNSEEHKKKISIGNKGKHHYWKGKHFSKEHILKIAEKSKRRPNSRKGCKLSEEERKKISLGQMGRYVPKGKDSPLYQKPRPEDVRIKISRGLKGKYTGNKHSRYGQHLTEETKNKISLSHIGMRHTEETKNKISQNNWLKNIPPEKTPGWKGGISYLPYCIKFNKKLKESIRNRDNRTCQLCNTKENGRKHDVHHIHHDKENCYPDLISLCQSCHSKVNVNKEIYESILMNNLNDRGLLFWTKKNKIEIGNIL